MTHTVPQHRPDTALMTARFASAARAAFGLTAQRLPHAPAKSRYRNVVRSARIVGHPETASNGVRRNLVRHGIAASVNGPEPDLWTVAPESDQFPDAPYPTGALNDAPEMSVNAGRLIAADRG